MMFHLISYSGFLYIEWITGKSAYAPLFRLKSYLRKRSTFCFEMRTAPWDPHLAPRSIPRRLWLRKATDKDRLVWGWTCGLQRIRSRFQLKLSKLQARESTSHLFTIDRHRLLLRSFRSRRVLILVLQRESVRTGRQGHQDLLLGCSQSTYQVYQAVCVQHVEKSHQPRGVKGDEGSVFIRHVIRRQRK